MNNHQSTGKTSQAHPGPANGDSSSAKASPQRRYRRSSHSSKPAVMTQAETIVASTTTEPASVTDAPAPPARSQASKAGTGSSSRGGRAARAKATTKPAAKPPAPTASPVEIVEPEVPVPAPQPSSPSNGPAAAGARPRTRNQRNGRRNKAPDVHLVVPPAAPETAEFTGEAAEAGEAKANGTGTASEMSPEAYVLPVVPVLTSPDTGPASEELSPAETEPVPAPSRRYRFDRRSAEKTAPAPAIRPERLSGLHTPVTPALSAAVEVPAPPESTQVETPEKEEPLSLFGPRPATGRSYTKESSGDDILSELGLRDARRQAEENIRHEPDVSTGAAEIPAEEAVDSAESALLHPVDSEPDIDILPAHQPPDLLEADSAAESDAAGSVAAGARPRRRRRRRTSHSAALETPESLESGEFADTAVPGPSTSALPAPTPRRTGGGVMPSSPRPPSTTGSGHYTTNYDHGTPPPVLPAAQAQPSWDISTAQQYVRQEDSPFGAPVPSFARGFGPQPRGAASTAHDPYTPRPTRTERGTDTPPMSSNQLANMVTSAIAQQTDRLLTEMRRQQQPPSMTLMFPPSVSTERVGIFVDVANLLYSARSLRISIDFGKLLEFLRGNRRLIRAHAYAPTNPDPGADQSFLAAVKGMGYRITTKNYKTFSSGAKKADMDLDLCMDIVRLVDAGALDTVVLVSGDSDFLPLLEYCSDRGVRVEAAAFDDSAAMILRQSCDLFINLTLAPDVRADK